MDVVLSRPLASFTPRACDCDFCMKHAASYISDADGKLLIHINNTDLAKSYKQGSGLADFLICSKCGVFVCVIYSYNGITIGSINSRSLENKLDLKQAESASPKLLSDSEKDTSMATSLVSKRDYRKRQCITSS